MKTVRLALFGSPVSRSWSPAIHKAFGRQFELEIDYQLIESDADSFDNDLGEFRAGGGHGCNITLPLKHEAWRVANTRSPGAELARTANTLWWTDGDTLIADNTDGRGLVRDIEHNLGISIQGKNILILGAGGASAGVLGAILARKPAQVTVANRTTERAMALAERHSALGNVHGLSLETLDDTEAEIILDSTSSGHQGQTIKIPEAILLEAKLCYSLNYGPAAQPMQAWCEKLGVPFQEGLGMLVEQAACSFEIWTGLTPQTESVYKDLQYATKQSSPGDSG